MGRLLQPLRRLLQLLLRLLVQPRQVLQALIALRLLQDEGGSEGSPVHGSLHLNAGFGKLLYLPSSGVCMRL